MQAQTREQGELNRNLAFSDERGSHLIPGYGPSVWRQNVALVQSSQPELDRLSAADIDRDTQVVVRTGPDGPPAMQALDWQAGSMSRQALFWRAVDDDFLALLQDTVRIDL